MVSIHNNIDYNNDNDNNKNVIIDKKNVIIDKKNVIIDNIYNQCSKCLKILSSKQYLNKHLLICKGVSNPLECHYCHKILANRNSKSKHLKICKLKENKEIELNNNNINLIVINNINLVAFDKKEEKIDYDISHLNDNFIYKLTTRHPDDAFHYYYNRLFENYNNRMVLKTTMENSFSNVHVGHNKWETFCDKYIYDKVINNIAISLLEYIKKYSNLEDKKLKKYREYINYMINRDYSNITPLYWNNLYRHNINKLKNLFHSFISCYSSTLDIELLIL